MIERERQINQGLRALDDAYRHSRIARDDYRKRRRQLLGSLSDVANITARNTLREASTMPMYTSPADYASRRVRVEPPTAPGLWRQFIVFLGTVAVFGALLYWFWLRHV